MTTRQELVAALQLRYRGATFSDRIRILDEFVALTGYHRKHAIRLLREKPSSTELKPARNRLYDEAVRQALIVLWEAADRICGKRLKALIPMLDDAMERHGHLDLDPVIKAKVFQVSAACIDRMLGQCAFAYRRAAQTPQGCGHGHTT
jgi:hypothetical protein